MENNTKVFHYTVTPKNVFIDWIIRTYLYKWYFYILYIASKVVGGSLLFGSNGEETAWKIYGVLLFFSIELLSTYRYFQFKKRIKSLYQSNPNITLSFENHFLIIKRAGTQSNLDLRTLSSIKDMKWHFLLYQGRVCILAISKFTFTDLEVKSIGENLKLK